MLQRDHQLLLAELLESLLMLRTVHQSLVELLGSLLMIRRVPSVPWGLVRRLRRVQLWLAGPQE
jgi:hypothetical protein